MASTQPQPVKKTAAAAAVVAAAPDDDEMPALEQVRERESKRTRQTRPNAETPPFQNAPALNDLAKIVVNAENDTNVDPDHYWMAVTWWPAQYVRMRNPQTGQSHDKVGMTMFKIRRAFHRSEEAVAREWVEQLRVKEKYGIHSLQTCGEFSAVMTDEEAAAKVGMNFGYCSDQPLLKTIMDSYQKNLESERAELAEYIHEQNDTTEMWRKLNAVTHDPSLLKLDRKKKDDDAGDEDADEAALMERIQNLKLIADKKKRANAANKRQTRDSAARQALEQLGEAFGQK